MAFLPFFPKFRVILPSVRPFSLFLEKGKRNPIFFLLLRETHQLITRSPSENPIHFPRGREEGVSPVTFPWRPCPPEESDMWLHMHSWPRAPPPHLACRLQIMCWLPAHACMHVLCAPTMSAHSLAAHHCFAGDRGASKPSPP